MKMVLAFVLAESLLGIFSPEQSATAPENAAPAVVLEPSASVAEEKDEKVASAGETAVAPSAAETTGAGSAVARSVKITSQRSDYDRKEGVIMFDGDVFVDDVEYKMHSSQLYVFLDGTNDLRRIVAIGDVAIINNTRAGFCAKAAYTKATSKIVMYGDGNGVMARLVDNGKNKSSVEGRKITFWIDSEQVEVEGSTVTIDAGKIGGKQGAKKLLGK